MNRIEKIALCWWSTWWHIFPLLAIYNFLKENNTKKSYNFIWIWEYESMEEKIANENNIQFIWISAWKIRRYFDYRNFYEPLKNLTWIFESMYYIHKENITIVFSKWWYVSLPMAIAAKIMRKKLYVHESDTIWWISNKIVSIFADKIFYTFPNNKIDGEKHILSWQILNPELIKEVNLPYNKENRRLSVLVTWWSQWSTKIFEEILKIVNSLPEIDFNIILWTKNNHFKNKFESFNNVKTFDFVKQDMMWKILKYSDISITRWWATTLWELYYFWIHAIIIPLKNSAWNHQMLNAKYFHEKFESEIIEEDSDISKILFDKLNKYKDLRKHWMNTDKITIPLEIIKKEIEK